MRRALIPSAIMAALVAGVACDIPTDAPVIDQTWVVPVRDLIVAVKELLPSTADTSGGGIVVTPQPIVVGTTLGALCGAPCNAANGMTIPKPAFTGSVSAAVSLPDSITELELAAPGVADLTVTNNLGFDPLRPGVGVTGRLITTLSSGGVVVGADTASGADVALPSGGTLTRRVIVPSGTVIRSPVTSTSLLESPQGDPVLINTAATFSTEAVPNPVEAARLNILIRAKQVKTQLAELDLSAIGDVIKSHILTAALQLEVNNPLPIEGVLETRFRRNGTDVVPPRTFTIAPGTAKFTLVFTRDEFLALTDEPDVTVDAGGELSGTGTGEVNVTPSAQITTKMRIGVKVRVGAPVE